MPFSERVFGMLQDHECILGVLEKHCHWCFGKLPRLAFVDQDHNTKHIVTTVATIIYSCSHKRTLNKIYREHKCMFS